MLGQTLGLESTVTTNVGKPYQFAARDTGQQQDAMDIQLNDRSTFDLQQVPS